MEASRINRANKARPTKMVWHNVLKWGKKLTSTRSRGEIGRHAGLRSQCPKGVGVQVPPRAPSKEKIK